MAKFLDLPLATPEVKPLLSSEYSSVQGTLLRAWASHSSLERMDALGDDSPPPSGGNGSNSRATGGKKRAKVDFRGLLLSNQTHRSSNDGEARLFKKAPGVGAFMSFMGHCMMENRNGLVVASKVSLAIGRAEQEAAIWMTRSLYGPQQKTLGADKGYDTREFVADLLFSGNTPHVAQSTSYRGRSATDGRTARHVGYDQSINAPKRIEQVFGWIKQSAGLRYLKAQDRTKVPGVFRLHVVAYKMIRLSTCSETKASRRRWNDRANQGSNGIGNQGGVGPIERASNACDQRGTGRPD